MSSLLSCVVKCALSPTAAFAIAAVLIGTVQNTTTNLRSRRDIILFVVRDLTDFSRGIEIIQRQETSDDGDGDDDKKRSKAWKPRTVLRTWLDSSRNKSILGFCSVRKTRYLDNDTRAKRTLQTNTYIYMDLYTYIYIWRRSKVSYRHWLSHSTVLLERSCDVEIERSVARIAISALELVDIVGVNARHRKKPATSASSNPRKTNHDLSLSLSRRGVRKLQESMCSAACGYILQVRCRPCCFCHLQNVKNLHTLYYIYPSVYFSGTETKNGNANIAASCIDRCHDRYSAGYETQDCAVESLQRLLQWMVIWAYTLLILPCKVLDSLFRLLAFPICSV